MAMIFLAVTQNYTLFFRRQVVRNIQYWQQYVATSNSDHQALDRERERLIKAITFGLEVEEAWPQVYELVKALAPYMERRGYWDTWNRILDRALEIARQRQDQPSEIDLSALLARLLYRQSRFRESVSIYRRVIHLARRLGREYDEARACTNLGFYYVEQGYWYRAEVLCWHALMLFEQIDNNHGRAHTENHLGVLYLRQKMWPEAQHHLKRACAIWQASGDGHGLMRGYANLGFLFNEMKQPDEAMFYLKKALDQAEQVGEEIIIGSIYTNMGTAFQLHGQLKEAQTYYRQAEVIFRRYSSLTYLADVHEYLGKMYLDQKQWSKSSSHLETALKIWRTLGNKYKEIQIILYFAESEQLQGSKAQAKSRLKEAENLLEQQDATGRYRHLHQQVEDIRRSLIE
jgi:tetratricopeptide (TPR) repeat protein